MADKKSMTVADVGALLKAWPPTERFTVTDSITGFTDRLNAYGRNENPAYFIPRPFEFDRERNLPFLRFNAVTLTNEGLGEIHFYMTPDKDDKRVLHVEAHPNRKAPPSFELVEHFKKVCDVIRQWYAQASNEEDGPRPDQQVKTTAAHYGITYKSATQDKAAQLMGTSGKTYRRYRAKGWLLGEQEFRERTGKSIADYWYTPG